MEIIYTDNSHKMNYIKYIKLILYKINDKIIEHRY